MALKIEVEQGSEAWHEWRKTGIGASDAPVIEGISPYKTLRALHFEKMGSSVELDEDDSKEFIFAQGHKVEKVIREQFFELTNVVMHPACFQHADVPYVLASLDGFDKTKLGVLEGKLVGQDALAKARDGQIPPHHFSQIQHQLAVLADEGIDVGHWFGHDGKKNGVLVTVKADKERIKRILDLEHQFWDNLMRGHIPPLSDRDYLTPADQTLLRELRDAKELSENASAAFEALKERVVKTYNHPRIAGGGLKLYRTIRQGALSEAKIPEIKAAIETARSKLTGEYIETFRAKPVESWTVRINTGKKDSA